MQLLGRAQLSESREREKHALATAQAPRLVGGVVLRGCSQEVSRVLINL